MGAWEWPSMSFFTDFDDKFFFGVVVICALLCFVDWAIGPRRRQQMREGAAEWWITLEDSAFNGLVAADAARMKDFLLKIFGNRWYSLRRLLLSTLVSTLVFVGLTVLFSERIYAEHVLTMIMVAPGNAILDWFTISVTIALFGYLAQTASLGRILAVSATGIGFVLGSNIAVGVVYIHVLCRFLYS